MARKIEGSSNRAFGLTFAVVFALIGCWPWIFRGHAPYLWALAVAGLFVVAAFLMPRMLSPLNRVWFKIGMALHHVVNPLLMALIYYATFVPIGIFLRLRGKDLLHLKRNPAAASYWIRREPPGPAAQSMAKQF